MWNRVLGLVLLLILIFTSVEVNSLGTRIINGDVAKEGQFPSLVQIRDNVFFYYHCAGVILNPNWIATVARCIHRFKNTRKGIFFGLNVVAGVHNRTDKNSPHTQIRNVTDVVFHPDWNLTYGVDESPDDIVGDLVLVQVEPCFEINDHVKEVSVFSSVLHYGSKCQVAGFGRPKVDDNRPSEVLRYMTIVYMKNSECELYLQDYVESGTLCAQDPTGHQHLCGADVGTGLMCEGKLVGLASQIHNYCKLDKQSSRAVTQFTDIRVFYSWITSMLKKRQGCFSTCENMVRSAHMSRTTYSSSGLPMIDLFLCITVFFYVLFTVAGVIN